jgi:hypothetical protein
MRVLTMLLLILPTALISGAPGAEQVALRVTVIQAHNGPSLTERFGPGIEPYADDLKDFRYSSFDLLVQESFTTLVMTERRVQVDAENDVVVQPYPLAPDGMTRIDAHVERLDEDGLSVKALWGAVALPPKGKMLMRGIAYAEGELVVIAELGPDSSGGSSQGGPQTDPADDAQDAPGAAEDGDEQEVEIPQPPPASASGEPKVDLRNIEAILQSLEAVDRDQRRVVFVPPEMAESQDWW